MTNRLAGSTSPYLRQHRDNPVDWWEWGPEAMAQAQRREVPLLISIGYSACHWCHVMAHESFEDPHIAAVMNDRFVSVKVDREERPDVDAVYMEATQAMTGRGGWPMTVFATPAGEPFFCGTYFPRVPHGGMPSFSQVLSSIGDAWRDRREDIQRSGAHIVRQLADRVQVPQGDVAPNVDDCRAAVHALAGDFDQRRGGFGGAPKFPPSTALEFLLRHAARTGDEASLGMAAATLEAMARGGLYDQLAGGFARYSVDDGWVVPHFEKMLYDNALLLRVYLHWWRQTGEPMGRRVALETAEFLISELQTPEGGFASALDADSEGEEGRFYVWTARQLTDHLGDEDGLWASKLLEVTADGTFEHGSSVLQLLRDPADAQEQLRWGAARSSLLQARARRVRPARDDKVVAAWNGLAIAALAEAGLLLDRPDLVAAAEGAARLLVEVHLHDGGRLWRTSRDGAAGRSDAVLEDHADVAEGLLALYSVTGESSWLRHAQRLLDAAVEHFAADDGGFFDSADDAQRLVRRPRDPLDGPTPSGASALAGALLSYAALSGSTSHRMAAERALGPVALVGARYPRAAGWGLAVAEALLSGPVQIAVVGRADDPEALALRRAAMRSSAPGAVVAFGNPAEVAVEPTAAALLQDRPLRDGRATAYVCRGFVCERPVTSVRELNEVLRPG